MVNCGQLRYVAKMLGVQRVNCDELPETLSETTVNCEKAYCSEGQLREATRITKQEYGQLRRGLKGWAPLRSTADTFQTVNCEEA